MKIQAAAGAFADAQYQRGAMRPRFDRRSPMVRWARLITASFVVLALFGSAGARPGFAQEPAPAAAGSRAALAERTAWPAESADLQRRRPHPAAAAVPMPMAEGGVHPAVISLGATLLPIGLGVFLAASGFGQDDEAGTLFNSALIWGGAIIGPATGHFASGQPERGVPGMLIRVGLFFGAWMLAPTNDFDDGFLPNPSTADGSVGVWALT